MADPRPDSRGRRPHAVGALAALVVLAAALVVLSPGLSGSVQRVADSAPGRTAGAPLPAAGAGTERAGERRRARPASGRPASGVPERIVVPALGVDAAVDPVELTGTTLVPPGDVARVGWWAGGARPGARTGTALLTGHTVHAGGGVFDLLGELRPADTVRVGLGGRELAYEVRAVRSMSTARLARRSERLFRQQGPGRLVLVTCTDWDGEAYRGSTVVVATPAIARG